MIDKILNAKILREYFEESSLRTFYDLDVKLPEGCNIFKINFGNDVIDVPVFSFNSNVYISKQDYEILEYFAKKYLLIDLNKKKDIDLSIENLASAIFGTPKKKLH